MLDPCVKVRVRLDERRTGFIVRPEPDERARKRMATLLERGFVYDPELRIWSKDGRHFSDELMKTANAKTFQFAIAV